MNKSPFYTPHITPFRSQAKSSQNNASMNEIMYDITELFNQANTHSKRIERMDKLFDVMGHYNQNHIDTLRAEILSLQQDVMALQNPGAVYTKTIFPQDMFVDSKTPESERALLDTQYDVVMLPYSVFSSSKLFVYDDINNDYILPRQLKYEVTPLADGTHIIDSDFKHALLPNSNDLWHREYRYLAGVKNEVTANVEINLPETVITNNDINTIYIHPFPLNSIDIMDVQYRLNGEWKTIPGFTPVLAANNTKFCFSELEARAIRVTLRQRNFISKGGQQVFHMGIREIGVLNNDYQNGIGRFSIPLTLNDTFKNKEILSIEPVFANAGTLSLHSKDSKLTTFKVYEVNSDGSESYLNDTFPISTTKSNLVIKGVMTFDRNTRVTPVINRINVAYRGNA